MDKMKMLNDEELENVVGGAAETPVRWKIADERIISCHRVDFFIDMSTGKTGYEIGTPKCDQCKFYSNGYCTNPDAVAYMKAHGLH